MNCRMIALLFVAAVLCHASVYAADLSAPQASGDFVIASAPYDDGDHVTILYNRKSGASWFLLQNQWNKIKETSSVPAGSYNVVLTSSGQPEQTSWFGFRIDTNTGTTWRIKDRVWIAMDFVGE